MKRIACLALLLYLIASTGCTTYYRVTDVESQRHYYTTKVQKKSGGAVAFKDSRTGSKVTLQSSQVAKINKEEFNHGAD
jgi:hypothetical protein